MIAAGRTGIETGKTLGLSRLDTATATETPLTETLWPTAAIGRIAKRDPLPLSTRTDGKEIGIATITETGRMNLGTAAIHQIQYGAIIRGLMNGDLSAQAGMTVLDKKGSPDLALADQSRHPCLYLHDPSDRETAGKQGIAKPLVKRPPPRLMRARGSLSAVAQRRPAQSTSWEVATVTQTAAEKASAKKVRAYTDVHPRWTQGASLAMPGARTVTVASTQIDIMPDRMTDMSSIET
ncbi:unnamed protein product [Parajaminaea phylloscopi]